jgi:hypothetical protein
MWLLVSSQKRDSRREIQGKSEAAYSRDCPRSLTLYVVRGGLGGPGSVLLGGFAYSMATIFIWIPLLYSRIQPPISGCTGGGQTRKLIWGSKSDHSLGQFHTGFLLDRVEAGFLDHRPSLGPWDRGTVRRSSSCEPAEHRRVKTLPT